MSTNQENIHSWRNMLFFFTGTFLSFVNFSTALLLLPLYAAELGGSAAQTGLQTTIFFAASILMRFYFGPLTDRRGRKLPLVIGAFSFGTAPLLFILADTMPLLTLARIYHAIGLAALYSSGGSLVADLAPAKKVGLYMGIYRTTGTLALLGGPVLAMYVAETYGFAAWFGSSFLIGMISVALLCLLRTPPLLAADGQINYGQRYLAILRQRTAWPIYLGIILAAAGYGVLITFAVLYARQVTTLANPALFFTGFSLAGVAGNFISGHFSDRYGRSLLAWPLLMLLGAGVGGFFLLADLPLAYWISSLLAGFGFSGATLVLIAWLVEVTDPVNRGTVLAMQESTVDLGIALGAGAFGLISGWAGMAGSFLGMGSIVLIPAVFYLLKYLRLANRSKA